MRDMWTGFLFFFFQRLTVDRLARLPCLTLFCGPLQWARLQWKMSWTNAIDASRHALGREPQWVMASWQR